MNFFLFIYVCLKMERERKNKNKIYRKMQQQQKYGQIMRDINMIGWLFLHGTKSEIKQFISIRCDVLILSV